MSKNFNFPYLPYDVQLNFMISLYEILENKKIGILESPTGTGKTLSILCSSLRWLTDHELSIKDNLSREITRLQSDIILLEKEMIQTKDWVAMQYDITIKKQNLCVLTKELNEIFEYEKHIKLLKNNQNIKKTKKKFYKKETKSIENVYDTGPLEIEEKDEFALKENENNKEGPEDELDLIQNENMQYKGVKIFYCSRTHSQLNQVSNEIKKTIYANDIRVVSLASRQNYCINSHIKQYNSSDQINEKCLDLQKNASSVTKVLRNKGNSKKAKLEEISRCEFFVKERFEEIKEELLCDIHDIEDLMTLGKELKGCPYYSSRLGIDDAHLILLPYQMLLNNKIRSQFKLNLKNNIVIIDEAHNLLDSLSDMHSAYINLYQLEICYTQLKKYLSKYMNRMKSSNVVQFNKLIFIVQRLVKFLSKSTLTDVEINYRMLSIVDLMSEAEFMHFNIREILVFCNDTRLADKVHGFSKNYISTQDDNNIKKESARQILLKNLETSQKKGIKKKNVEISYEDKAKISDVMSQCTLVPSVIRPVIQFLESLTGKIEAGGVLVNYDKEKTKSFLKYVLLKPGEYFKELLDDCRSLVLAGGTMQPTSEIISLLFKGQETRIEEHSFDHVVTQDACLPLVIKKGPRGENFLFTFNNRNNPKLFQELGSILVNVSNLVPHGIVVFFSSYDYLSEFFKFIKTKGISEQIEKKKQIFMEPRSRDQVDKVLHKYRLSNEITSNGGGILFSVVGGKLSEGLNFSDNLGRCVIVVGMPYPNKNSPELMEKIKCYNNNVDKNAGSLYYENLCMKAVNQSIGRAIRHINDYASILLLDERYGREDILSKLPKWIRSSLRIPVSYGQGQMYLARFFANKRK